LGPTPASSASDCGSFALFTGAACGCNAGSSAGIPFASRQPLAWRLQQIGRAAVDHDWCGTVPKRFPPPHPCRDSTASVRPAGELTKGRAGVVYAPIGFFV
jgi:hypothetical protein